jgi:hypothetical protein
MLTMSDETMQADTTMADAVAKTEEENLRKFARLQAEEVDKHNFARLEQNLNRLSNFDFRRVIIERHGFDPGV